MQNSSKARVLCVCALSVAIAFALGQLVLFRMPLGGSVRPCSMVFVAAAGYWFGGGWGVVAGAAYGLLNLAVDPYIIHPAQMFLDYLLSYITLGALPALLRKRGIVPAYLLGVAGRFVCVFLSGMIFFGELAPGGQYMLMATLTNSVVYNLSYIVPEAAITLALLSVPALRRNFERMKA